MKKLLIALVALALLALIPVSQGLLAKPDQANKVGICHFEGHDGDFVLSGAGRRCVRLGGNPIEVGIPACFSGHGASGAPPTLLPCDWKVN